MKKREFLKKSALLASSTAIMPSMILSCKDEKKVTAAPQKRLRTAHIGVGNMGGEDLRDISSHSKVNVTALCDVDANNLAAGKKITSECKNIYRLSRYAKRDRR